MRLVLSGYYGFRNSGDEAVLLSILNALEEAGRALGVKAEPVVLSADPEWTSRQYGVRAVPRMKPGAVWNALKESDGLISGGGSLLQDATGAGSIPYYLGIMKMARWCGKPVFVYAQGIGPVNRRVFWWPIARAFRQAAYVSVRDEESAALLEKFGVPGESIHVVPDPVMGLSLPAEQPDVAPDRSAENESAQEGADARREDNTDQPSLVGVSVRFWRGDRADLDRAAAALAKLAMRRSIRLRFLPLHQGEDEEASRYVMQRIGGAARCELAPVHEDPRLMLREVGRCRLLVGMRLHALIYAANREVPLLGISYDPKIDAFLARLGQRPVGTTEELDPDDFTKQASSLLDQPEAWRAKAGPVIARLKTESVRPAQQILAYKRI
jgi:polysaccharide pyruvyl transferase CsaB